jgi:hypothetical protein
MPTKHIFQFLPKGTLVHRSCSSEFCLLHVTASIHLQSGICTAHPETEIVCSGVSVLRFQDAAVQ